MTAKPLKCYQSLSDIPWQAYRLPSDGRKVHSRCIQRKGLLLYLAGKANPDGTRITVSVETMANAIGDSIRAIKYLLDELGELGFLEKGKLEHFNGPRQRRINIAAVVEAGRHCSAPLDPVEGHLSADSSAPLDADSSAPLNLQKCTLGNRSSAPCTSETPGNPPKVHTTASQPQTNRQPTGAPEIGADGWEEFVANLQPCKEIMRGEPGKKQEPQLRALVKQYGGTRMAAAVALWTETRNLVGMEARWYWFLKEFSEKLLADAWERTPEGRAAKDRQEEAAVRAAEEYSRRKLKEAYGDSDSAPAEQTFDEFMRNVK